MPNIPNPPSVAVIIPCWNAERWVACAIQSALDQDYPSLEVVVVDDGSTDNSLEVIKSFGNRVRWESEPNRGAPAARNRGLELSNAEFVLFLDADDWLAPAAVSTLVEKTVHLPQKAIVFGDTIQASGSRKILGRKKHWLADGDTCPATLAIFGLNITSPLHRRTLLLEVGGFDVGRPSGQVRHLHWNLVKSGVQFVYTATDVFYQRLHAGPGRISRRPDSPIWADDLINIYQWLRSENYCFSLEEREFLAKKMWLCGRKLIRDRKAGFDSLFQIAESLSPNRCIEGGLTYRALNAIGGPIWAERFASVLQQMRALTS